MKSKPLHVIVIGGGIAGLSAAFSVSEEAEKRRTPVQCTVLEKERRWGGKILTHATHDLLIEGGPDSFLATKPAAVELCRRLGLEHRLLSTNSRHNRTFAFCRGALRELPQGLLAFRPRRVHTLVTSGLLSIAGTFRMAAERIWPSPAPYPEEETLSQFFCRRFGQEAFQNVLEPLVAGIYAGDAEELSLEATFPRFQELERKYGSVIKGMRAPHGSPAQSSRTPHPRLSMFVTLQGGLGELIQALLKILQGRRVMLNAGTGVKAIAKPSPATSFRVELENGEVLEGDRVILTSPAYQAARMLQAAFPDVAEQLDRIPYASTATVSLAYKTAAVREKIHGFGFVVPRKEQRTVLAATWSSLKWEHRTQPEDTLVRAYVGGRGREAVLEQDDRQLGNGIQRELADMTGLAADPHYMEIHRWVRGMPQYVVGHLKRVSIIERHLQSVPGLFLAGAAYRGIGIPDCIQDGDRAAQKAIQPL